MIYSALAVFLLSFCLRDSGSMVEDMPGEANVMSPRPSTESLAAVERFTFAGVLTGSSFFEAVRLRIIFCSSASTAHGRLLTVLADTDFRLAGVGSRLTSAAGAGIAGSESDAESEPLEADEAARDACLRLTTAGDLAGAAASVLVGNRATGASVPLSSASSSSDDEPEAGCSRLVYTNFGCGTSASDTESEEADEAAFMALGLAAPAGSSIRLWSESRPNVGFAVTVIAVGDGLLFNDDLRGDRG